MKRHIIDSQEALDAFLEEVQEALGGCRDRCARHEAENAELRAAVGIARAAMVDALAFHHHVLSGPVKVQLNTAINTADSALAASEGRGEL